MRRATGIDSLLLGLESPTVHYHTLKLAIVEGSAEPESDTYELIRTGFAQRLHLLPPLRWRLLPSPLGIAHPLIVEDPDFDLDRHMKRIEVPAPGDLKALFAMISEEASTPLARNRPLWEICIFEGLENGRVGLMLKIHHAIADGNANVLLMQQLFLPEKSTGLPDTPDHWQPDKIPSWPVRLGYDVVHMARVWTTRLPELIQAKRKQKRQQKLQAGDSASLPPSLNEAPATPWNHLLSSRRELACSSLPLADVLTVKSVFEVSVNDVAIALVASALRSYLQRLDVLPEEPLVFTMPMSTRSEENMVPWGNQVTAINVALRTDVADPVERLYAGREASQISQRHFEKVRGLDFTGVVDLVPDLVLHSLVPGLIHKKVANRGASLGNLSISNVQGPRSHLFAEGSKLESFFSAGMLNEGTGIGFVVWSYADQFNFTLQACPDLVPDVWQMIDGLKTELDILLGAAQQRTNNSTHDPIHKGATL